MTLNERIQQLEAQVRALTAKLNDLSKNTEEKSIAPFSKVGSIQTKASNFAVDAKTGQGLNLGNHVIWNDSEMNIPPLDDEAPNPNKGYNKHTHSRYSGGALIVDILEFVEYEWGSISNKHSQQFWTRQPRIATVTNSEGQEVEKIGKLNLEFDPETQTWKAGINEIDVKTTYFVEKNEDGTIVLDENGNEKKSVLYNEDTTKSSVIWDKNAQVWRFYATYAPGEE